MKFFDANCCLGELSVPMPEYFGSVDVLAEAMERAGIDEALVYHARSREYSPAIGNRRLLEETAGREHLHPCWTVLPHHTGEMPPAGTLVEQLAENGVHAVRAFPRTQNWPLDEWAAGRLLSALEENAVPFFIDLAETDFSQIHSLCHMHPRLPVVLTGALFRLSRWVYALLAETPNLHVETSSFQLHCGIEDICGRFGAGRLVFGTAAPHFSGAPSVMAVKYAGVSEDEKSKVAGGNLRDLLGAVR
jgi:predicted TIM-barrel fold metal-dependent hydrolase